MDLVSPRVSADQYHEFNEQFRDIGLDENLKGDAILRHNLFDIGASYICPFCFFDNASKLQECPQCKLKTCHKCKMQRWPKYMIELNVLNEPVLTKLKYSCCCYCEGSGLQYPKDSPDDKEREWRYIFTGTKETSYLVNSVTQKMAIIVEDDAVVEDHITLDINFYPRPMDTSKSKNGYYSQSCNDIAQIRKFIKNRNIDRRVMHHPVKDTRQFKERYYSKSNNNKPEPSFTLQKRKLHIRLTYYCNYSFD